MIDLSPETETIAVRLAEAQRVPVDTAVRRALEERVQVVGLREPVRQGRMNVQEMLAVGAEIAAMPLLDARSPAQIMDDLNAA